MKFILIFIAVIAILVIRHKLMDKIDHDEAVANATPGRAAFIRDNFPNLVERLEKECHLTIEFERKDLIRFKVNYSDMLILQKWSGNLFVGYIHDNQSTQEWNFPVGTSTDDIVNKVFLYLL